VLDDVRTALDEDLDAPAAMTILDRAARSGRRVVAGAALLGINV
jgi:hypothetical protein